MKLSLEQLKAMSDKQLKSHWVNWGFPFDALPGHCGACLFMHRGTGRLERTLEFLLCWNPQHKIARAILPVSDGLEISDYLRAHLEELYAARLFFENQEPADLPKPAPAPPAEQHADLALETVPGPK